MAEVYVAPVLEPTPVLVLEATAYTAYCNTGCIGMTATGIDVSSTIYHEGRRIVAVDPNVIPLGSHVTLSLDDGRVIEATAQDTGGAIVGNRLDLLVSTKDEAWAFGRQDVEVEVLD
jgi:3D (Asp-Asp-Asp) domain-containing protein